MIQPKRYPGRYLHLFRLWQEYVNQPTLPQLDRWLAKTFQKNKNFGKKDRLFYTDLLFAGIRFGYLAVFLETGWTMRQGTTVPGMWSGWKQRFLQKINHPENLALAFKSVSPAEFFVWIELLRTSLPFNTAKYPDPLHLTEDEQERWNFGFDTLGFLQQSSELSAHLLRASCPLWFEEDLSSRIETSQWTFGQVTQWLSMQSRKPPLWIRVHHRDGLKVVLGDLKLSGFEILKQDDLTLAIKGDMPIYEMKSYQQGLFEIQDFASQQIGKAVDAQPGQSIWDMCAGGGGKTMQLAANLQNKGVVHATEIRDYKLKDLKERAKRASFFHIQTYPWDGNRIPAFSGLKNLMMDRVLIDAPCSGSGTWRRNPDAKYRPMGEALDSLCELQLRLLTLGATRVKKGGLLIYATCSWIPAENESVVQKFLDTHPVFQLQSQTLAGCPQEDADTMFVAVLNHR